MLQECLKKPYTIFYIPKICYRYCGVRISDWYSHGSCRNSSLAYGHVECIRCSDIGDLKLMGNAPFFGKIDYMVNKGSICN